VTFVAIVLILEVLITALKIQIEKLII